MGAGESTMDTARIRLGHRVLEVTPGSPGSEGNLCVFFDIIVAINGTTLDNAEYSLVKMVVKNVGLATKFTVYNMKAKTLREVVITPRRDWGGRGILGLVARYDSFHLDFDDVALVTDVLDGSPAAEATLQPNTDFILGAERITFRDSNKLVDTLYKQLDNPIVLYVYNPPSDTVRPIAMVPSTAWLEKSAMSPRKGLTWKVLGCGLEMGPKYQIPSMYRTSPGRTATLDEVRLLGAGNITRLKSLGNLMERTMHKRPAVDPSKPLPPPPPPPLPGPPLHHPDDEDEHGNVMKPPSSPDSRSSGSRSRSSSTSSSSSSHSTSSSSGDEARELTDHVTPLRRPSRKPVMTSAEMDAVLKKSNVLVRTKGLGTHRMTRGAQRRISEAAAKRAALTAQGRINTEGRPDPALPPRPVELMFKTREQRKKEEDAAKSKFELSNPLLV